MPEPMQWIFRGGSLLLLTLLTACSSKSSVDELTKELQTVNSWAATAQMVGDSWIRGVVPTAYAKQTLSTAQKELQKETGTLFKASIAPSQYRTILEHLQRLQSTVGDMSKAVEQGDKTALAQQLKQLSTQKRTISQLDMPVGGQP